MNMMTNAYPPNDLNRLGWKVKESFFDSVSGPPISYGSGEIYKSFPPVVFLWNIMRGDRSFDAKKPIIVHVYRGESLFLAENDTLNIYASGVSYEEAISEFKDQLIHQWEIYGNTSIDDMIGDAKRLKRIYKNLFLVVTNK